MGVADSVVVAASLLVVTAAEVLLVLVLVSGEVIVGWVKDSLVLLVVGFEEVAAEALGEEAWNGELLELAPDRFILAVKEGRLMGTLEDGLFEINTLGVAADDLLALGEEILVTS